MKSDIKAFRVDEDEKLSLARRPTRIDAPDLPKESYARDVAGHVASLESLQERLYRAGTHAVLLILQGMDTAGKDGAIKHVMTGVNPQGCKVVSFKPPTPVELRHDFLWRAACQLPERGEIGVFNRSLYEEVLVTRVHPEMLAPEAIDPEKVDLEALFKERYHSIRAFERHLSENGTCIVKVFLHISKEEQRKRLLRRLDDPEKTWKASASDGRERNFWKEHQRAYELALAGTSHARAPWYVVPADDKWAARLAVSQILIDALDGLPLKPAAPSSIRTKELSELRKQLEA